MKTVKIAGTELEIFSASALHSGAGHKKITIELHLDGNYQKFSATSTDMQLYDDATDLEGEDKDEALFNMIAYRIEDEVSEWVIKTENQ
ncbi:hypothetical protein [Flavobacterium psychrophilum]|uniref:hypothetical protein n=1 Tax=Flavobacterium psychrophilum TaxID=96345 RepID=UPI00106C1D1D|nr:hypothetical protein [Flavobacterium psychrophilum]